MLNQEELTSLAQSVRFTPYVAGDIILDYGHSSKSFYLMTFGTAQMVIPNQYGPGQALILGELNTGEFFGEISLLFDEPMNYRVRAISAVECYRIDKTVFKNVFLSRPELIEELTRAFEVRQAGQQHLLASLQIEETTVRTDVMSKVKTLLGMDLLSK
jgi:CRP-like cAMP-binding protein